MKSKLFTAALVVLASAAGATRLAAYDESHHGHESRWRATLRPWHYGYYHASYGAPMALVIPPTAEFTSDYVWGVGSLQVTRNDHQFQRPYPGPYPPGTYGFSPTPPWPSSTRQFGVYYNRGPW